MYFNIPDWKYRKKSAINSYLHIFVVDSKDMKIEAIPRQQTTFTGGVAQNTMCRCAYIHVPSFFKIRDFLVFLKKSGGARGPLTYNLPFMAIYMKYTSGQIRSRPHTTWAPKR